MPRSIAPIWDGAQGTGYKVEQLRAKAEMTHIITESLILTAWLEIVNAVPKTNEAKEMEKVTFSSNIISKWIDNMSDDKDSSDPWVYEVQKSFHCKLMNPYIMHTNAPQLIALIRIPKGKKLGDSDYPSK